MRGVALRPDAPGTHDQGSCSAYGRILARCTCLKSRDFLLARRPSSWPLPRPRCTPTRRRRRATWRCATTSSCWRTRASSSRRSTPGRSRGRPSPRTWRRNLGQEAGRWHAEVAGGGDCGARSGGVCGKLFAAVSRLTGRQGRQLLLAKVGDSTAVLDPMPVSRGNRYRNDLESFDASKVIRIAGVEWQVVCYSCGRDHGVAGARTRVSARATQ